MRTKTRRPGIAFGDQPILTTYRRPRGISRLVLWVALAAGALVLAYAAAVRPWQLHWGATAEEARQPLPGDDFVSRPLGEATRAITVDAPPEAVWPWLVQMGQGRGGLYSHGWLENLIGGDTHTVDRILPELQQLRVGDTVRLASEKRFPSARLVVARIQPGYALVLRSLIDDAREPNSGLRCVCSWTFVLDPLDDGRTRLIVRARHEVEPRLIGAPALFLALEPVEFLITREMLRGIKERVESAERQAAIPAGQRDGRT